MEKMDNAFKGVLTRDNIAQTMPKIAIEAIRLFGITGNIVAQPQSVYIWGNPERKKEAETNAAKMTKPRMCQGAWRSCTVGYVPDSTSSSPYQYYHRNVRIPPKRTWVISIIYCGMLTGPSMHRCSWILHRWNLTCTQTAHLCHMLIAKGTQALWSLWARWVPSSVLKAQNKKCKPAAPLMEKSYLRSSQYRNYA